MKKRRCAVCVFGVLFLLFSLVSLGAEDSDLLSFAEDSVGYASFLESIPEHVFFVAEESGIDFSADAPSPNLLRFFGTICLSFFRGVTDYFPILSVGLILILVFKLLSSLSVGNGGAVEALGYLAVLSSGVYSFSVSERLLRSLQDVVSEVSSFLHAALPVITATQTMAGNSQGALAVSAVIPTVLTVLTTVVSAVFSPLCWFCYAAALLNFGSLSQVLRPLTGTVKKLCLRGVEIVSGLAVGVFCVQRVSVGSSDSLSRKTASFAFSRLFPVAGGVLSDGLETVYACGRGLLGKVGIVCVMVVVILFAIPCILGLIFTLLYSVLASVGSAFGVSALTNFFTDVKDTFAAMTGFSVCALIVLSSGILLLLGG